MGIYKVESNSRRVVEILQRSIESTSRAGGNECRVIQQGEKSVVLESGMPWPKLDSIISSVRTMLFHGEEFSIGWPDGQTTKHERFEPEERNANMATNEPYDDGFPKDDIDF